VSNHFFLDSFNIKKRTTTSNECRHRNIKYGEDKVGPNNKLEILDPIVFKSRFFPRISPSSSLVWVLGAQGLRLHVLVLSSYVGSTVVHGACSTCTFT